MSDLNSQMSFDHVIRIGPDGTISDGPAGIYAPELLDEELSGDDRWSFFSAGYTGQYGYSGPIMHNSEFIGGSLATDILQTPGLYAAIVAYWGHPPDAECTCDSCEFFFNDPDENDPFPVSEGWAIVRMDDPDSNESEV